MHEGGSEAPCPLFSFAFYLLFLLSFVRGGDFDTLSAQWDWKDIQIRELTGAQDRGGVLLGAAFGRAGKHYTQLTGSIH
jgi:hypothetical protein